MAAPGTAISPFDGNLLEGAAAGESATELSRRVGGVLSPAECALRVRTMLTERDIWTDPERKKLLLYRIYNLVDDLAGVAKSTQDTKDYTALTKGLDLLRKTLNEQSGATDDELRRLVAIQVPQMLAFIKAAYLKAQEILSAEYPELPFERIQDAFETALVEAEQDVPEGH